MDDTFVKTVTKSVAMTSAALDADNDIIPVIDISQTTARRRFKRVSPRALLAGAMNSALQLSLLTFRTATGLVLTATPGAGVFGISLTPGTSGVLTGETASSNTKTDKAVTEVELPASYVPGAAFNVVVNCKQTGVATVKTIDASLWKVGTDGAHASDLVTTAAQAITTAAADYTFAVDGTTLNPGDRVVLQFTSVSTEAAAGNTNAAINSARLTF